VTITPIKSDAYGLTRWIDREAKGIHSLQYVREMVQNGIEAGATHVMIDEWFDPELDRYCVRITDNGTGFTGGADGLRRHMLTMHSTGKDEDVNYGIGARLASLPSNPKGVIFATRNEIGFEGMVMLSRERGQYGIYNWPIENDEGTVELHDVVSVDDELSRLRANETGTAVILRGDRHSTWEGGSTAYAINQFLSGRYFAFPEGVRVSIRRPDTKSAHGQLRPLVPMGQTLDKVQQDHGVVPFTIDGMNGMIHWWIMTPMSKRAKLVSGQNAITGGVGFLVEDEVFAYGKSYAPDFGLVFKSVRSRVVVLVSLDGASMDTARGSVVLPNRGKGIPWKRIGRVFAENMPEAISALNTQVVSSTAFDAEIEKFLDAEWRKFLEPIPVTRAGRGTDSTGGNPGGGLPKGKVPSPKRDEPEGDVKPRRPARIKPERIAAGDTPAVTRYEVTYPEVRPVDPDDWDSDNYNVYYNEADNTVYYSRDLLPYRREVTKWIQKSGLTEPHVRAAVEFAYRRELSATVLDVKLQRKAGLTDEQIEAMTAPAALYTKMLGMQAIEDAIGRTIDDLRHIAATEG
jgi:hypothetical protein